MGEMKMKWKWNELFENEIRTKWKPGKVNQTDKCRKVTNTMGKN